MAGGLSTDEQRVLDAIDEQALFDDLRALIRIPSITGSAAESDIQDVLARRLRELDLDVDHWRLDLEALRADPDFPGSEVHRDEGWGLAATYGEGRPALILSGHVDVVPIGDPEAWEHPPFEARLIDGVIHGRGACDMKAGIAVNLAVTTALVRSGIRLERALGFHSVVSEEDGGLGAFATMRRGHRGDACVLTEPTGMRLITANAGALTFRIEVEGRATHGSTSHAGVSAIDAFWPVREAIGRLESQRNSQIDPIFAGNPLPYAISIGTVHAGDWASSVPDRLVAEGRMGVMLGEDSQQAMRRFEDAVTEASERDPWLRQRPPVITWPGGRFDSGRITPGHPLIGELQGAIADTHRGRRGIEQAAPYGSDLRLYVGLGKIPTLHYGPGDVEVAHSPREAVSMSEVASVAQSLAVLAVRRLNAP